MFIMKRAVASTFLSPIAYILVCFFLIDVCLAESENLRCAQRTILKGLSINGSDHVNCQIESEGQTLEITDCTVWSFGGDHSEDDNDCSLLKFSPSVRAPISGVEILPFVERFPNFRIKFKRMDWLYMHYRMQIGEQNQRCHKLEFAAKPEPSLQVSFACKVFGAWAAGQEVEVLMDVGNSPSDIQGHAHYIMKVATNAQQINPLNKSIPIADWYVTVVVDISQKPYLRVYWPIVPQKYNVTKYNVQLSGDKPKTVDLASCPDGYCFEELFAGFSSRNVTVYVQPIHEDCVGSSCYSSSPVISLEFSLPVHFILLIVVVLVLVLLIIVCSVYYFSCVPPRDPLEVLLLYDATTKEHTWVVRRLVKYLEEVCGVHCLEAEREIPRTESQNPDKWLRKAMEKVDAVLYVASPTPVMDVRYCEYPQVVYRALELISEFKACRTHNRPGRYLVAVPLYCSVEDIPPSLAMAPRFWLPDDLSWLLWTLYNQHCWVVPFTWLAKAYLRVFWCPGPVSAYRGHGKLLADALDEAESKKKSDERQPPTPLSDRTGWTNYPPQDDKLDNGSVPEMHKRIYQEALYGEEIEKPPPDEERLVPRVAIDLNELSL